MLDYGHNPAGYEQAISACKGLSPRRLIGVIGMPGDRTDDAILSVGKQCAGAFDRIYIKEDLDPRGRERGEVSRLFHDAIVGAGFPSERLKICEKELDALKEAVSTAQPDDLIAVFYEKLEPLREYLDSAGAQMRGD